jgi:D-alanine-D-alanine ligase-like ATP-grasp enzyme
VTLANSAVTPSFASNGGVPGHAVTSQVRRLFQAVFPDPSAPDRRFVWLSNFDAERHWDVPGAVHLPSISQPAETAIVNRIEEMTLLLAGQPDTVILRERSDPDFLAYLEELGFALPSIVSIDCGERTRPASEAILDSDACCERLKDVARRNPGACLLPYGKTRLEEEIGRRVGLPVAGPDAALLETVNSKLYSRRITEELGLRSIPGRACASLQELEEAAPALLHETPGGAPLVLKEAMGVSGRGLVVLDNEERLNRTLTMLRRKARPDAPCHFVLEQWVGKLKDINYQLLVLPSGEVRLLSVKEAVAQNGVHMGHRSPAVLSEEQLEIYRTATQAVGRRLFQSGFTGLAGIDSLVDDGGDVYPVLEINARFNMSTYQLALERMIPAGATTLVKHYSLSLSKRLPFSTLRRRLEPLLFGIDGREDGVGIMAFAPANCNAGAAGHTAKGRLYVFLTAGDFAAVERLDAQVLAGLAECSGVAGLR